MALPVKSLPRSVVTIEADAGPAEVPIRGLSRAEVLHLTTKYQDGTALGDIDAAEVFILKCGAEVSDEDAKAFRDGSDATTVGTVIDAILALSGLTKDGKSPQ